jgi:ribosomal protein L16 Arg81 hydroxylase
MLYLPPHYAHEGVAMDECMTYSIGFRAPSYQELGEAFLESMIDSIDLPGRYSDPDLKPSACRAEISNAMLSQIATEFDKIRFTREDIVLFLGEYLTKSAGFLRCARAVDQKTFCSTRRQNRRKTFAQNTDAASHSLRLYQRDII